jgi:hypothetical protein
MQKSRTENIRGPEPDRVPVSVPVANEACFLTVAEAARLLRVSKGFLDKRRLTGDGPIYLKIGKRVVYDRAELVNWATSNRRQHTSEAPEHVKRDPKSPRLGRIA